MSKKVKRFFNYLVILFPFALYFLSVFRVGTPGDGIFDYYNDYIIAWIENSIFVNLYNLFTDIFSDSWLFNIIFYEFIMLILLNLMFILFDLLMFIPNFVSKMFDKIEKAGVKDE